MASHFMEADVTLIEELRHSSKKKKTKQSTKSIGQLCLFWHFVAANERADFVCECNSLKNSALYVISK